MARPQNLAPRLSQRSDGRYFTKIAGDYHHLGRDLAEARRRFGELLANSTGPTDVGRSAFIQHSFTVGRVLLAWLRSRKGKVDPRQYARSCEAARACLPWRDMPADQFHQGHLDAARSLLLSRPSRRDGGALSRNYVNRVVGLVQTAWRWAASRRLVTAAQRDEVCALQALGRGEGGAERSRRRPPPRADVEAALAVLGRVPAAMVRLQLLTGMRPGEVCGLTPAEVDREGFDFDGARWWIYVPQQHKTAHLDKPRLVVLSPAAQAVLAPFLERDPDAPCFSPRESDPHRARHDAYPVESYTQAIGYACSRAGVPTWTAHQLRHLASTSARDAGASREDTAALLGHAQPETTDSYTHALLQAAARAAEKLQGK